jgi:hypothetical protein
MEHYMIITSVISSLKRQFFFRSFVSCRVQVLCLGGTCMSQLENSAGQNVSKFVKKSYWKWSFEVCTILHTPIHGFYDFFTKSCNMPYYLIFYSREGTKTLATIKFPNFSRVWIYIIFIKYNTNLKGSCRRISADICDRIERTWQSQNQFQMNSRYNLYWFGPSKE